MAFFDDIVNFVDKATALPGEIARRADDVNDRVISIAQDLQNALEQSGEAAERNLTRNKIASLGRNSAEWIADNFSSLVIAGVVIFAVGIIFLRK